MGGRGYSLGDIKRAVTVSTCQASRIPIDKAVGSCGDKRRRWLVVKRARVPLLHQDKADHEGGEVRVEEGVAMKRAVM